MTTYSLCHKKSGNENPYLEMKT